MTRGLSLANGETATARLYFRGGPTGVRLAGKPQTDGQVSLALDGRLFEQPWLIDENDAYIELGPVNKGVQKITVGWFSCPELKCTLKLDRVEVRPMVPQATGSLPAPESP
jgi:hypothetical protein